MCKQTRKQQQSHKFTSIMSHITEKIFAKTSKRRANESQLKFELWEDSSGMRGGGETSETAVRSVQSIFIDFHMKLENVLTG
jgi:hypothetical protein